jgi:repressor LexA
MQNLTARQQEIFDYLLSHQEERGYPPTLREICAQFGMRSTRAASDHLKALERKGYISRNPEVSRGIELLGARPTPYGGHSVPLVGRVAAGTPLLATENITDRFTLDPELLKGEGNFLLEVQGESMIEAHICPGDMILVRPQEEARTGDVVVALLDEEEATVKRFEKKGDRIRLLPENRELEPIEIVDPLSFKIIGIVVGLIRRFR